MIPVAVAVGIVASLLGAISVLDAPRAAASGTGCPPPDPERPRWDAGGEQNYAGIGVEGVLSIHAPADQSGSMSKAYIAAVGDNGLVLKAGWKVSPDVYGDNQPHLFVGQEYCEGEGDDELIGWTQISKTIAPGMVLKPGSAHLFRLTYEAGYSSWHLWFDSEHVGSATAFGGLTMARAEWYGEVDAKSTPWPCAEMGAGVYGNDPGAAYMMYLGVLDWSWTWHSAKATSHVTTPRFYNVGAFTGASFRYGGPGAC
jgi:hypothetical protein